MARRCRRQDQNHFCMDLLRGIHLHGFPTPVRRRMRSRILNPRRSRPQKDGRRRLDGDPARRYFSQPDQEARRYPRRGAIPNSATFAHPSGADDVCPHGALRLAIRWHGFSRRGSGAGGIRQVRNPSRPVPRACRCCAYSWREDFHGLACKPHGLGIDVADPPPGLVRACGGRQIRLARCMGRDLGRPCGARLFQTQAPRFHGEGLRILVQTGSERVPLRCRIHGASGSMALYRCARP